MNGKTHILGKITLLCSAVLLVACAHSAPRELVDARTAYERASHGPSKEYTPAELHVAHESLGRAEQAFADKGDTILVRDQAYIAQRKAELAEASARLEMSLRGIAVADHDKDVSVAKDAARTRSELAATKQALTTQKAATAATDKELADERTRRAEAEQRAAKANADLALLASVKQETRGTVITLSGSVLFASNKFALLPAAQVKLGQVAEALLQGDPEASFVVEGHTDSQGKPGANQELSVNRANAVRQELIVRGIAADRITAEGHGADRTVADNKTTEGRANNRRVEIVVKAGAPR
jgi:outer membrane protein OmpA-like peptidoglycan-associated protein